MIATARVITKAHATRPLSGALTSTLGRLSLKRQFYWETASVSTVLTLCTHFWVVLPSFFAKRLVKAHTKSLTFVYFFS